MQRGKNTCKILKEIRKQIAEANDIEYVVSECKFKGDCLGTCPKCEAEVRYLEQQIERRRMLGKAVVLAGISMNVIAANAVAPVDPVEPVNVLEPNNVAQVDTASTSVYKITGKVVDENGEPVIGASVFIGPTSLVVGRKAFNSENKNSTISDMDGRFTLNVDSLPQEIKISHLDYLFHKQTITVDNCNNLVIELKEAPNLIEGFAEPGYVITGKVVDDEGEPLIGAQVRVAGQKVNVITDLKGKFTMQVNLFPVQIEASFPGYGVSSQEVTLKKSKKIVLRLQNMSGVVGGI